MSLDYESLPNLWVKVKGFLRHFPRNLRSRQDFYATAGRSGRAKYQLCVPSLLSNVNATVYFRETKLAYSHG